MSSTASTGGATTMSTPSFETRVSMARAQKRVMNTFVLDYLTMEGYATAAANFAREANLMPQQNDHYVESRQKIKASILMGDIDDAITMLNQTHPEDRDLHFSLLRLQLVELIRETATSGSLDFSNVLKFSQDQLAPHASTKQEYLTQLEETMVMLFFTPDKMPPAQQKLLSPELRQEVANRVNTALLLSICGRSEAAIRHIIKMRAWAEKKARDNKVTLPFGFSIGLDAPPDDEMDTN